MAKIDWHVLPCLYVMFVLASLRSRCINIGNAAILGLKKVLHSQTGTEYNAALTFPPLGGLRTTRWFLFMFESGLSPGELLRLEAQKRFGLFLSFATLRVYEEEQEFVPSKLVDDWETLPATRALNGAMFWLQDHYWRMYVPWTGRHSLHEIRTTAGYAYFAPTIIKTHGHDGTIIVQYGSLFLVASGCYSAMPLLVCWFSMNLGGHPWQTGFGNIGGIISTYSFLTKHAPRCRKGYIVSLSFLWNIDLQELSQDKLEYMGDLTPTFRSVY
ncbi:hypothetical protein V8F44DRAFT_664455 [Aspergillus fumigatus]